jgi:urea carboxylase
MAPAPIFDPAQRLADFRDSPVFTQVGDIFKHRPIDRPEFDELRAQVEEGTFRYRIHRCDFEPRRFFEDAARYDEQLLVGLYGA